MKTARLFFIVGFLTLATASCSVFKPKYGCPATGKNAGAEKLISDPNAGRKTKKFRA